MKKILIFIFLFVYSFAIKDFLVKPNYDKKVLYKSSVLSLNDEKITEDDYNVYKYNSHFRVIFGKSYKNSSIVNSLADSILSISENVWKKEIEEFKFKAPINSDIYYIDIYIANRDAYNYESNSYITISNIYTGYATSYDNKTPYFVINPDISKKILKVTLAHEFFHIIQYAYGLYDVSINNWYKNTWFLEASAVMMEDEVYDDVNDYVGYLTYYTNYTYKNLDYSNGSIEYGKVLFAKYLKEKYGLEFIKKIFEDVNLSMPILYTIKKELDKKGGFLNNYLDFAKWVANPKKYFEEGNLYPNPKEFDINTSIKVNKYGFILFKGNSSYLVSSNPLYLQATYDGDKNIIADSSNGIILLAKKDFYYNIYSTKNIYSSIKLKKGWNLIANSSDEDIELPDYFNKGELIWVYRDNKYWAYSSNSNLSHIIKENNLSFDNILKPKEAMWVFTPQDEDINFNISTLNEYNLTLQKGWNFISISSSSFDVNELNDTNIIWHYNKDTKKWEYYGKKNLNFDKIKYILPFEGYFIYKK